MLDQVAAVKIVWISDWGTTTRAMDVQAFRVSDSVALVALPGELFVELDLAIKQSSPFAATLVVSYRTIIPAISPRSAASWRGRTSLRIRASKAAGVRYESPQLAKC